MTYDVLKAQMGKEFVVIVELYLDYCQNVYGTAPCTASVPATGSQKCFNTLIGCQDTDNYDIGTSADRKIYRFATTGIDGLQQDGEASTFPTLRSIDTAPTRLDPGKGLGIRSSVVMQVVDHPWTDVGIDPYVRDRTYVPDDQGTFWGKLLARNPYYEGRRIDVLTGYIAQDGTYDATNFQRRTYLVSKISGPDGDGVVTIEAKDPLKRADVGKAQWPIASSASLTATCLIGDTTIGFGDPDGEVYRHAVDLGQTYIRVNDEVMKILTIQDDGGYFYTATVSRTDSPSVYDNSLNIATEHAVGTVVQMCWLFDDERVDHILYTLLYDASGIETGYLPTDLWNTAIANGALDNYLFTTLLIEPTGVQDLLQELSQHGIYMWWDEREQKVLIRSLITQAFDEDPMTEDTDIVAGTLSVTRDIKNRLSQVWVLFGLRFPTLDMDLSASYSSFQIKKDADAESAREYDQSRIMKIFSRWMPSTKSSTASEIANRILVSYRDTRTIISMSLDPKDDTAWTGDLIGVLTAQVQDMYGAPLSKNYLVLQVDEKISDNGILYGYILRSEATLARAGVITPNEDGDVLVYSGDYVLYDGDQLVFGTGLPFPDYTAATAAQKAHYLFIAPDSGVFDDGEPAYQIR